MRVMELELCKVAIQLEAKTPGMFRSNCFHFGFLPKWRAFPISYDLVCFTGKDISVSRYPYKKKRSTCLFHPCEARNVDRTSL